MNRTRKTLLTTLMTAAICTAMIAPAMADPLDGAGLTVTDDWGADEHRLCNGCSPQVGNYIATWQVLLKADDAVTSACATVDGIFGSGTGSATARWQSSFGLAADGIVGPASWGPRRQQPVPTARRRAGQLPRAGHHPGAVQVDRLNAERLLHGALEPGRRRHPVLRHRAPPERHAQVLNSLGRRHAVIGAPRLRYG
jgi:peptidoglycan hydrolase-like protein with peptidoglycan-binding domain